MKKAYCKMLESDAKKFKGDKALYWAGKLSHMIGELNHIPLFKLSEAYEYLSFCKEHYDQEIISRGLNELN